MSVFERRSQSTIKRFSMTSSMSSMSCLTSLTRDNDVVKRGCLHMKRPPTNSTVKLRIKAWQKRYLVLRDAWTPDGDTILELHNTDPTTSISSPIVSESASVDDVSSVGINRRSTFGSRRHYAINLRTVMYVEVYQDSKRFPNAFIVFRTGKSPLIFGARTDLEMREWMMAIKLLADKLHTRTTSVREVVHVTHSTNVTSSSRRTQRTTPTTEPSTADGSFPPATARRRSELPPLVPATTKEDDATILRQSTPQLMTSSPNGSSPYVQQRVKTSSQHHKDNQTKKEFSVRIQHYTDAAMTRRLHGDYILVVSDVDISLCQCHTTRSTDNLCNDDDDVIVRWPMHQIRKLKCESCDDGFGDVITLVAMSDSPSHDGATYQFRAGSGPNVIRCVRQLVRKMDPNAVMVKSRDDLTSAIDSSTTSSSVNRKHITTSDTPMKMTKKSMSKRSMTSSDLLASISRGQPDLPVDRTTSCMDAATHNNCSTNIKDSPTRRRRLPSPTQAPATAPGGDGAFYLPLVDSGEEHHMSIIETDGHHQEADVALSKRTPTYQQAKLSKSTGALNHISICAAGGGLQSKNGERGSAGLILDGAPIPPPRPFHTMSNIDN